MKVGMEGHILLPNLRFSMLVCVSISVCEKIYFIYNLINDFPLVGMEGIRLNSVSLKFPQKEKTKK